MFVQRDSGNVEHRRFGDLPARLRAGDLLIANDSRVFPARLHGHKESGGAVELLVLGYTPGRWAEAMFKSSKPLRCGQKLIFGNDRAEVCGPVKNGRCRLEFERPLREVLCGHGSLPLPPYIKRPQGPQSQDEQRYQTVYARAEGSVAAPTAGLHFTSALIDGLKDAGIAFRTLTLHVGPGTFVPVRDEDHRMEAEECTVEEELAVEFNRVRARGGRIVAVGTTSVRALETACSEDGRLRAFSGKADLFIKPGYRFRAVDALISNFHLPATTLLALVSAFGGDACMREAYRQAVALRYRFYSYGDAMLVV